MKRVRLYDDLMEDLNVDTPIDKFIDKLRHLKEDFLSQGYSDVTIETGGGYDYMTLEVWGTRQFTAEELQATRDNAMKECTKRIKSLSKNPELKRQVFQELKKEFEPTGRSTGGPVEGSGMG